MMNHQQQAAFARPAKQYRLDRAPLLRREPSGGLGCFGLHSLLPRSFIEPRKLDGLKTLGSRHGPARQNTTGPLCTELHAELEPQRIMSIEQGLQCGDE